MIPQTIQESYAFCHEVMRTAARNFYFGMRLLPEAKRNAMYALYGFMRRCDDLTDDPLPPTGDPQEARLTSDAERRRRLAAWRDQTHAAIDRPICSDPIWPAFHDTVRRFQIPRQIFDDAIDGQMQDLEQSVYPTFDELYRYCYRVASTVGIAAVHIWGFRHERAIRLAEQRGIAMQLTNILRDIREDAARGRQYLPTEDFDRFGLTPRDMNDPQQQRQFDALLAFQAERAAAYYRQSAELEELITPDSRPTLQIMTGIYSRILERIRDNPHLILIRRVSLSTFEKLSLVARHTWHAHLAPLQV